MKTAITVTSADLSERIDHFLSDRTGITRSKVQKLIRDGLVLVNGASQLPSYKVRPGDMIAMERPERAADVLLAERIPLTILYADEHLAVIDKPAGMVVYPGAGHEQGTLLNALVARCAMKATVGAPLRPGVVHRLDKDTSGVIVVALNDHAYYDLAEQFRQRTVTRSYKALVFGNFARDTGEVRLQIGRSEADRKKMSTRTRQGKASVTSWTVLRRWGIASLIKARLGTGRTHQIRVHFSAIGHPVLGDRTYGRKTAVEVRGLHIFFPRQMLHAQVLGFNHPVTRQHLEFSSPLPEDIEHCIRELSGGGDGSQ